MDRPVPRRGGGEGLRRREKDDHRREQRVRAVPPLPALGDRSHGRRAYPQVRRRAVPAPPHRGRRERAAAGKEREFHPQAGDSGLTGVCIIKCIDNEWEIDSLLLSCRIIGKGIENAILARVCNDAKKDNIVALLGEFILTKKNEPAREFFNKNKFNKISEHENKTRWKLELKGKEINYPNWIQIES